MLFSTLSQPYIFMTCVYFGIILACIYDIFRYIRLVFKRNKWVTAVFDVIFMLITFVILLGTFYLTNDMQIHWFMPLGVLLGIIIYIMGLRKLLQIVIKWVYNNIIYKIYSLLVSAIGKLKIKIHKEK